MDSEPTPATALLNSFIPDQRLVRCTAGGITFVIPVISNITFGDLCKGIILNNQSISLDQTSLWYSFPNQVQCILRNDQDVYLMFQCQRMLRCEFVDLEIRRSVPTNIVVDGPQSPGPMNCNNNGLCLAEIENQIRPTKTYLTELWRQYIHSEEQVFKGAKEFKEDLIKYSISLGFSFDYVYNDKDRVTAKCSRKEDDGCEWRVQASKNRANGLFYIRKLNNIHTCSGRYRTRKNKKLNSSLVASLVIDNIRDNPRLRPKDIVSDFKGSYSLNISYWNAWFGREVARTEVHGSDEGSYAILTRYIEAINETNPGSRCVLEFDNETRRFRRLFVAFGACIEGFEKCRPLLALDGTFLKSKYKGTLIAATAKDGDQVVDNENSENWRWFVDQLWYILGNGRVITFISDRNEGLINAIKDIFPHSPHGYCLKHIQTNIQSKYPGQNRVAFRTLMVFLFAKCAYALTTESFNYWFTKLNNEGGDVMKRFLKTLPLENWANSRFYGWRYGEMCSNIAESFNAWIMEQRHLPITQLVDGVRSRIMKEINQRRMESTRWTTVLCPKMEKELEAQSALGRHWLVKQSSETVFEVKDNVTASVDLENKTCSCRSWQVTSFPCAHAAAVFQQVGINPYPYIEWYYRSMAFQQCYSFPIHPVTGYDIPTHPVDADGNLLPPITKKQAGRPRHK